MGSRLSLEEKTGQVFMLGFHGRDPEDADFAIRDIKAGGIIYFARNTGTVRETACLSAGLQDMAIAATGIPLLISADQEGGVVSRLTRGLPAMPGAMALGAAGDPLLTQEVARAIGVQLRAAGINMDLAPVLDVNDNPMNPVIGVRSFGGDPAAVSAHGQAAVRGLLQSGIAPVGKHFPGHGNTSVDSHLDLPVLLHPMERLQQVELAPFRAAIEVGVPAIMPAHIVFTAVDPEHPATMSTLVLVDLLRRRMGFRGLIMTDCLEMDAVSRSPGTPRAAVLALKAGADLLLVSHTKELQVQAYEAVLSAVRAGEVPESRLDEAAGRVLALKEALKAPNPLPADEADTPYLRSLSCEAHLRSITVVRAADGSLPLRPASGAAPLQVAVIHLASWPRAADSATHSAADRATHSATYGVETGQRGAVSAGSGVMTPATYLALSLSELPGLAAREVLPGSLLSDKLLSEALPAGPCPARAIVLVQNAWKDASQASLARKILRRAPGAIVAAVRDPFDLSTVPAAKTFICAYGAGPEAMHALARVLAGQIPATGRLPVALE